MNSTESVMEPKPSWYHLVFIFYLLEDSDKSSHPPAPPPPIPHKTTDGCVVRRALIGQNGKWKLVS